MFFISIVGDDYFQDKLLISLRSLEIYNLLSKWKKERETDRYNNALFINYSYGITGHKAQGGEWDHVIVDLNSSAKPPPGWMYTAITRASQKVMIVSNE